MKKIRRIPTILGLFIILISIGAGVIAFHQGSSWLLRAEPETIPKQVKITNITDSGFAVSWTTDSQTTGFVKYGSEEKLTFTANDDQDQISGTTGKYFTHYFTLQNLSPTTNYSFKLGSAGKVFDNNGQPYEITTAPTIKTPSPPSDVANGTIMKANGSPVSGAIVYLSLANTTPQSALTKTSGSWVIPLNLARSDNLGDYAAYDKDASIEDILVQGGAEGTATAVATTRYDSPLPTITLGQNFDFRKPQAEVSLEETPPAASKFTFGELSTPSAELEIVTITSPAEGEVVNTTKPAVLGTGPAGESLTITIKSPATSGTTVVDEDGDWQWDPPENLEPGEHTVTASYTDEEGKVHFISRFFTVLAAGESELPAIESTPSATPTPSGTPSPTKTPTPTPTISPTPTPVEYPEEATLTPVAEEELPEEALPEVGLLSPTFFTILGGVILVLLGLFL